VTPLAEGSITQLFKAVVWAKDAANDTLADCLTCVTNDLPSNLVPQPVPPG
jgi:hypothetical protein